MSGNDAPVHGLILRVVEGGIRTCPFDSYPDLWFDMRLYFD